MLNKILDNLKIHALAIMCLSAAFFFWKDYFQNPRQLVTKDKLAYVTGTLSSAGNEIYLPSGSSGGHYVIIKEANRTFIPNGIKWGDFVDEVPTGATITMSYSPEENLMVAKKGVTVFSLKYKDKEYISDADTLKWYNDAILKKRNIAIYLTLGGIAAFVLVWWIKRRFFK
ncbi:hypothetical protein ACQ33O_10580 [Ferruginibacter sp. SUN002]|uniref:hypothetical protein n=1 Tax=Ferruginibacter sp. SUN002 TaxID=2937789 RepID=UPI003D365CBF